MAGIGQDNYVVNFYVTKGFLRKIDKYAKHYGSRSAFLVKLVDACLDDSKTFAEAIARRMLRFMNHMTDNAEVDSADVERVSVQIVMPRKLLQRLDRYAAALGQSRAAALNTAAEIGLDVAEPFIKLWTTKPGLAVAKVINKRRKDQNDEGVGGAEDVRLAPEN